MARTKIYYSTDSCPRCNRRLLRTITGNVRLGSPLIRCKHCNVTYRTYLRQEWLLHKSKWSLFQYPIVFALFCFLGPLFDEPSLSRIPACLISAALVGLTASIPTWIRISRSKARMRKLSYLQELFAYGVITPADYQLLSRNAK